MIINCFTKIELRTLETNNPAQNLTPKVQKNQRWAGLLPENRIFYYFCTHINP